MTEYIILFGIYFILIIAVIALIWEIKHLERKVHQERIRANHATISLWVGIHTIYMYPEANKRRASEDYDEWCVRIFSELDPNIDPKMIRCKHE